MNNTATFAVHIINITLRAKTRWDGYIESRQLQGALVECEPLPEDLSQVDTLEVSCHSPTRILLPAL